jgi:hypothetical protein
MQIKLVATLPQRVELRQRHGNLFYSQFPSHPLRCCDGEHSIRRAGDTPLHIAAREDNLQSIRILLLAGAGVLPAAAFCFGAPCGVYCNNHSVCPCSPSLALARGGSHGPTTAGTMRCSGRRCIHPAAARGDARWARAMSTTHARARVGDCGG